MFVPLSNEMDQPLSRLRAIAPSCASTKAQERAIGYGPMATAVSEAIPPILARPFVRLGIQAGAVRRLRAGNLMVSNVPGPNFALFFAGMRMEAVYPLGPVVDGVALNITVQTYLDSLYVGINACAKTVHDPRALAELLVIELNCLAQAEVDDRAARQRSAMRAVLEPPTPTRPTSRGPAKPRRSEPAQATAGGAA